MIKLWLTVITITLTVNAFSTPFFYSPKNINKGVQEPEEPEGPERPPLPQGEADEEECEDSLLLPKSTKMELL